jgi:pimeloyl-ACP methyl ester carboxylesterase
VLSPPRAAAGTTFPVGYRAFHPDPSINFELNRWLGPLPEEELRAAAPRIATLPDWTREMRELAERAEGGGRWRAAAFYWRAAEFFLPPGDPEKARAYRRFRELFEPTVSAIPHRRARVPYQGAWLPAIVIPPSRSGSVAGPEPPEPPRAARAGRAGDADADAGAGATASTSARHDDGGGETVLLHGGFDSFMEELFDWALELAEGGFRVILFEGPGQGAVLREHGLPMTPQWEKPVGAVLDHFRIERATLVGISLGGYLAPRAAAFEPRIERVVCCDVLDDFFDCFAARAGEQAAKLLFELAARRDRAAINDVLGRTMLESPATGWAIHHGMHVSGAADPYELVLWLREMSTASFSRRITQDVLLLAGAEDHIVPPRQLWRQAQSLPNARSVTTRVFTAEEHAQSHCQIGNVALMLGFVRSWIAFQAAAVRDELVATSAT